jgi:hypothetical protein
MSHSGSRTSALLLRNCSCRLPTATAVSCAVDSSRISGTCEAARTSRARSWAVDWLSLRQAGRLGETRVGHAQQLRLDVHRRDEGVQPARIGAPEGVRSPVLRRHQRQVQHLAARQAGADMQPRAAALVRVDVGLRNRQLLVERLPGVEHDERRHQLGDGGDRQHRARVLAEQDLVGVLVDHQRDAGPQIQRVIGLVQPGQVAERGAHRHGPSRGLDAPARRLDAALATRVNGLLGDRFLGGDPLGGRLGAGAGAGQDQRHHRGHAPCQHDHPRRTSHPDQPAHLPRPVPNTRYRV